MMTFGAGLVQKNNKYMKDMKDEWLEQEHQRQIESNFCEMYENEFGFFEWRLKKETLREIKIDEILNVNDRTE